MICAFAILGDACQSVISVNLGQEVFFARTIRPQLSEVDFLGKILIHNQVLLS